MASAAATACKRLYVRGVQSAENIHSLVRRYAKLGRHTGESTDSYWRRDGHLHCDDQIENLLCGILFYFTCK